MSSRARRLLTASALLTLVHLGAPCRPVNFPEVWIDGPPNGTFTTAASVVLTGHVTGSLAHMQSLTVNGVSVLPLAPDRTFSTTVVFEPGFVVYGIEAELTRTNATKDRQRITLMIGESIADGDFSPMGLGMRLNDSGLDSVEPTISSLVDLDLATLLPLNTVLINNQCMIDSLFGCLGRATVRVTNVPSPNPQDCPAGAPSISGFGIAINSQTNFVDGDIDVNDMCIHTFIDGTGLVPDCGLLLTADTTNIDGDYGLQPDGVDPSNIDVNQNGNVSVFFNGFTDDFTSGLCDAPIIGDLIGLIVGDVEPIVVNGLVSFLADPDGGGPADSPVADAVEVALAGIEITGPIGQAIGVNLEAPLFDVFEDVNGITLDSDARVTASAPDPLAPNLLASYHVDETFPSYGPNTPVGGLPYGLALSISSSAFNQLLKAEIESGLLRGSITELDLDGPGGNPPFPITAGLLALLIPQFGSLPPETPLTIEISPRMAPAVTGNDGPFGEIEEMLIPHLVIRVPNPLSPSPFVQFIIDVTIGLEVDFVGGELQFLLGTFSTDFMSVTITENSINANETALLNVVLTLAPSLFPSLADSLGTFPLPDFLGLQLSHVEIAKLSQYLSLFVNLTPAP
jgi:hypothetical protein